MCKLKRVLLVTGILSWLPIAVADAQPPWQQGRRGGPPSQGMMQHLPIMAALDQDKDGTISDDEIKNSADALRTLDKNDDHALTAEELRPKLAGTRSGQGNRRGDGYQGRRGSQRGSRPMMQRGRGGPSRAMAFGMRHSRGFAGRGYAMGHSRRGFGPPAGPHWYGGKNRGPQARGPQARGPQARGPQARGPQARGPQARGPQARGPQARGPQARGLERKEGKRDSDRVKTERAKTEQAKPEQAKPEQAKTERAKPDQPRPDRPDASRRPGGGPPSADMRGGFRGGPPMGQDGPPVAAIIDRIFDTHDANNDGKLSKDEAPDSMWDRIGLADGDDDAQISREELTSRVKKLGDSRRGFGAGPPDGFRGNRGGRGPRDGAGPPPRDQSKNTDKKPEPKSDKKTSDQ
ncbi:EF hand [Planctomycetes bacterium CA13]|uniref:EF hand n=1 Tax=Novipirellula herctigrandis TaxID=2527986 RepID=A0A5C5YWQ3_9BACT|nr:EF hand [Planctomycetes bacterium CA13]